MKGLIFKNGFLGKTLSKPKQSDLYPYRIMYDERDNSWKLNRGLWEGVEPNMKIEIYRDEGIAEGSIDFVYMQKSRVSVLGELTTSHNYPARLTQFLPLNIRIFAPELEDSLRALLPEDIWTSDSSLANVILSKENNLAVLQTPGEKTSRIRLPAEPGILSKSLQRINLWSLRRNLTNMDSSIQRNQLSLQFYQISSDGKKKEMSLTREVYIFELEGDESITLQLEATNHSSSPLFFAVFQYKKDYSLIPFSNIQVQSAQSEEVFKIEYSVGKIDFGLIEDLQLFVSREKLDESLIRMQNLSHYIQELQIEKRT